MTSSFYKGSGGIVILYKIKYFAVQSEKSRMEDSLGIHTCYTPILRVLENVEFPRGGASLNFNKEKKEEK